MDVTKYSAATALIVAFTVLPLPASADLTKKQVRAIVRQELAKIQFRDGTGPPGPQGRPGAPGAPGGPGSPGEPGGPAGSGTTFRFAFVDPDGRVDPGISNGITQDNVSVSDDGTLGRTYLFSEFADPGPSGAQVTEDISFHHVNGTQGEAIVTTGDVLVCIRDLTGLCTPSGFYVVIY